tara:strand:+ start:506 stop:772 length:267 start_codon:yes stop_codon:yes gene_type:complete
MEKIKRYNYEINETVEEAYGNYTIQADRKLSKEEIALVFVEIQSNGTPTDIQKHQLQIVTLEDGTRVACGFNGYEFGNSEYEIEIISE